ncbi:dihydrolipoamide acetyltransferase family protein [Brevundimonas diminuta]|jgi:pyruvate dehydrogenase E2 component (dihydrolipoamide acetyltransferase)|uniref:dihydrolipoamide acetyltransferase family protein n=1 Tax=Brevundimonas diminuta TaxID=293 RepID=UPI0035DD5E98
MIEFRMPSLGADMEGGVLVEWHVKPGDPIKPGDILAVVETHKGAIEIEGYTSGVLDRYLVEPGANVSVGAPIAMIRAPDEPSLQAPPPNHAPAPTADEAPALSAHPGSVFAPAPAVAPPSQPTMRPQGPGERVRASPAARLAAAERGLDLAEVVGSGPGGTVRLEDVTAFQGPGPGVRPVGFDPAMMREAIATAMSRSKREIPHYYLADTIDIQPAVDWLERENAERTPERRLLMGALFMKAAAIAAGRFAEFNGTFEDGVFNPSSARHLGMAIAMRGGGLAAPAIHDAAALTLDDLMAQMRDLVVRARTGRFRSSEIAEATLTVSSLGERGVELLFGVIYPPQVAIIGFGKIVLRPWVDAGLVRPRSTVSITLAADHRVSDGRRGAGFLNEIGRLLQTPEAL